MPCAFTNNRAPSSACGATKAGLDELNNWFIDRDKITFGAVNANTGVITTFTIDVGAALHPFAFDRRGFAYNEVMNTDNNTGATNHTQTTAGRLIGLSGQNRADVEKFKGTNLVQITRAKSGKFLVFGRTAGLTLTLNEAGSQSENLGELVNLANSEGAEESEKYAELLMTDETTTLAALIAAETIAT